MNTFKQSLNYLFQIMCKLFTIKKTRRLMAIITDQSGRVV
jgi:hypothetical protein